MEARKFTPVLDNATLTSTSQKIQGRPDAGVHIRSATQDVEDPTRVHLLEQNPGYASTVLYSIQYNGKNSLNTPGSFTLKNIVSLPARSEYSEGGSDIISFAKNQVLATDRDGNGSIYWYDVTPASEEGGEDGGVLKHSWQMAHGSNPRQAALISEIEKDEKSGHPTGNVYTSLFIADNHNARGFYMGKLMTKSGADAEGKCHMQMNSDLDSLKAKPFIWEAQLPIQNWAFVMAGGPVRWPVQLLTLV